MTENRDQRSEVRGTRDQRFRGERPENPSRRASSPGGSSGEKSNERALNLHNMTRLVRLYSLLELTYLLFLDHHWDDRGKFCIDYCTTPKRCHSSLGSHKDFRPLGKIKEHFCAQYRSLQSL